MNTMISILLLACTIGVGLCLIELHKAGKAEEWFSDWSNQRKLRKCFGQEGITVFIHEFDRSVSISFHHKGACCSRQLTFTKAYALYLENPKGYSIRQKLVKMFK